MSVHGSSHPAAHKPGTKPATGPAARQSKTRVLVPVNGAYEGPLRVVRSTGKLDVEGIERVLSLPSRQALTLAKQLQRDGAELVAIHVDRGGGEEVLREAIACGADHGILIDGTLGFEGDAASRAALIADVVRAYGPFDAVLGPAWSEFGGFTGTLPAVAGQLDLPCVVGVTSIKVESFSFLIGYDSLFGTYDLRIPRPAVVVVGDVQADDPTAWGVRAAWETGIQRIQADARSLHKPLTKRLRIEAVKEEKRTVETVDGATLVRRMRSRGLLGDPEATA